MTEKEKMLSGMIYSAVDKQLLEELNAVKEVIHRYNALSPADNAGRMEILKGLLGNIADDEIIINQPFYCDYGKQISVGKHFFANFQQTSLVNLSNLRLYIFHSGLVIGFLLGFQFLLSVLLAPLPIELGGEHSNQ